MDRKKIGILIAAFAACLLLVILVNRLSGGIPEEAEEGSATENVYTEVPDGELADVPESKTDAYMASPKRTNIVDYWDECEEEMTMEDSLKQTGTNGSASSTDLFGYDESSAEVRPAAKPADSTNPYRETAREREQRHQKRREEAIELADRMQKGQDSGDEPEEDPVPETISIPSADVRRSDVVSSLDDGWSESGVSSLDENFGYVTSDEEHPFKCMFVREEKIKSGQRVSVRLLEDIVVGGILIPKNSHLMAGCTINRRLEMEISNIEMHGRILTLGYEAYDTDGTKGIYCPDVGTAGKTARSKGTSLAGTALSSRVGRLASDVVTTGVSIIESASGERTVSVPAGYTFFIVRKKQP